MKKNSYWTEEQYEEWLEELYSKKPSSKYTYNN